MPVVLADPEVILIGLAAALLAFALLMVLRSVLEVLAGAVGADDLPREIAASLRPGTDLVGATIDRLLAGPPFADLLPRDDLTAALAALFLGIELLSGLDPDLAGGSLFATMESAATLLDALVRSAAAQS